MCFKQAAPLPTLSSRARRAHEIPSVRYVYTRYVGLRQHDMFRFAERKGKNPPQKADFSHYYITLYFPLAFILGAEISRAFKRDPPPRSPTPEPGGGCLASGRALFCYRDLADILFLIISIMDPTLHPPRKPGRERVRCSKIAI